MMMDVIVIALLVVFLAVLLVVILFMGFFRTVLMIGRFAGPNVRLWALGDVFVDKGILNRLLDRYNVDDIKEEMKQWGYSADYEENVELELEKDTFSIIRDALAIMPDYIMPFTQAYMMKYDAFMLKRLVRLKSEGKKRDEIQSRVFPVYEVDEHIIQKMLDAGDVEDALASLSETGFGEKAQDIWREQGSVSKFEIALDMSVLEKIKLSLEYVSPEVAPPLWQFFGIMVDIHNVKTVLRGKKHGYDVSGMLMEDAGRNIGDWLIKQMMDTDYEEALRMLDGTPYELGELKNLYDIERALDMKLLRFTKELATQYSTTVGPCLNFILSKEYELRNLKVLLQGVSQNIDKETFGKLLIWEEAV